jgi:D-serine deaminase-like pyridoxal phosphate-dependent protein
VDEAEMLAANGADDIVLAYPLYGPSADRFIRLTVGYPDVVFTAVADCRAGIDELSQTISRLQQDGTQPHGTGRRRLRLLLDVDCGMGRTGTSFEAIPGLWAYAEEQEHLEVYGLHVYDGQVRETDFDTRCRICDAIYERICALKKHLQADGAEVERIIAGGTISFPCYARRQDVELSPGTFVFHDAGYRDLYPDLPFEPAAVLFSRVISIPAQNRISIDAGSKAISTDPAGDPGTLLNIPGARSLKMSEEHWTFEVDDAAGLVPGSPVFILPVHICPTVNLYDAVYTLDGDGKWGPLWRISARGHQLD